MEEVPECKTISPKRKIHVNKKSKCGCGLKYCKYGQQIFFLNQKKIYSCVCLLEYYIFELSYTFKKMFMLDFPPFYNWKNLL